MPFLAHFGVYELLPRALGIAGIGCFIFVAAGVAYFLIRDTFRFGRTGIPLSWMVVVIALFTGFAFLAARYAGLLVAPVLGVAYALGYWQAHRDARAKAGREHRPST